MGAELILAIDQGTTGTTVAVFDKACQLRSKATTEFPQIYPNPGWVEHNPDDIWTSVLVSIEKAFSGTDLSKQDIRSIGITNQRETTVVWDRETGTTLHNAIVWQCRRTAPLCEHLKNQGYEPLIKERTGLVLDPYFSGTKIAWLLENMEAAKSRARNGELCFGTIDSFLINRLTGNQKHLIEISNASRTMLMNLVDLQWDLELCDLLGIPVDVLPRICSSSKVVGTTIGVKGLPDGIPICGIAGDQQAALFGQACFAPGQVKCTYGTGAFLLMNTGADRVVSNHGLLTTVAWRIGDVVTYALEGSVFIAGAAVQWLRDGLGCIEQSEQVEALAAKVPSSEGVVFVPALTGLGAPKWRPHARGLISGITRGTTAAHLARATLEGIAFSVRDVVLCMQNDAQTALDAIRVDGGASANNLMMQFQSDILSTLLLRPKVIETTALGAALLSGLGVGTWENTQELEDLFEVEREFCPQADPKELEKWISAWEAAIEKA